MLRSSHRSLRNGVRTTASVHTPIHHIVLVMDLTKTPTDPRLRERLEIQLIDVLPPSFLGYHDGIPQTEIPKPVVSILAGPHPTPHRLKGRIGFPPVVPPGRLVTLIVTIDKQSFVPCFPLLL